MGDTSLTHGPKRLLLGCALTGAKFTPLNHKATGDPVLDAICCGDGIPVDFADIQREAGRLYQGGCRYLHIHARNPKTREQSCSDVIYAEYNRRLLSLWPGLILSYGASRNGVEIIRAIKEGDEWARVNQAAMPLEAGGAHFVTIQAAVELQIVKDLEKQGFITLDEVSGTFDIHRPLDAYEPSGAIADLSMPVYSTEGGRNYGQSSARMQYVTFQEAIRARCALGLAQEVEWVQLARSHVMTYLACKHLRPGLMDTGRLNITILFGFSPKLPFPLRYGEFRRMVDTARSLEEINPNLRLSIGVGAAVLPQHAEKYLAPLDVGPLAGQIVSPIERLVAYASQPGSGVDMVRFGMEDTPYLIDTNGTLQTTTNLQLMDVVLEQLDENEAEVVVDPAAIQSFASCDEARTVKCHNDYVCAA